MRERVFLATKIEVRSVKASDDSSNALRNALTPQRLICCNSITCRVQPKACRKFGPKAADRCRYVGVTSTYPADHVAMEAIIRREKPDFVQVELSTTAIREPSQKSL